MRMPEWLEPMAATLTQDRPQQTPGPQKAQTLRRDDWLFERKYDGIRLLSYKRGNEVKLYSRNRLLQHSPRIENAVRELDAVELILDGEVAWDRDSGYHVFDILWLNGEPTTALPLEERRALLKQLKFTAPLRRVDLLNDEAPWERARREGWEGVIAKRKGSPYEHRRSKHWLKMKCEASQELVVGGFTDPRGARLGLGALLVGYYEPGAKSRGDADHFVFAGKIGTGFDTKLLLDLRKRLDAIEIPFPPFTKSKGLPRLRAHWVKPSIVVQVSFIEWTPNNKLRHPRLIGVRFDTRARDVVREQ